MYNRQPDSIEISAMAVVMCKGKILTTVENIYGKQTLSLPKGHQEENELLIETAIRECFEETNIVIEPSDKLIRKTVAPFLFEIANEGKPIPKEERIISVQWMSVGDFLQNCTHDNVKLVVKET